MAASPDGPERTVAAESKTCTNSPRVSWLAVYPTGAAGESVGATSFS
jgi:hypothetical protein